MTSKSSFIAVNSQCTWNEALTYVGLFYANGTLGNKRQFVGKNLSDHLRVFFQAPFFNALLDSNISRKLDSYLNNTGC